MGRWGTMTLAILRRRRRRASTLHGTAWFCAAWACGRPAGQGKMRFRQLAPVDAITLSRGKRHPKSTVRRLGGSVSRADTLTMMIDR